MNQDIFNYIERHIDPHPDNLHRLERATNIHLINGRMCSGHLQGRLLKVLTAMIRPKRVLELGTFSGYSALCIAEGLEPDAHLDTIEFDDELEDFIRTHFDRSPLGKQITLHIGDACQIIEELNDIDFDLVFVDANKRHYVDYYRLVLPRVRKGGFIIADNTLWDGKVVDWGKKLDDQTRGILEFNDLVAQDPSVETVILPLRDGLTILYKK